MKIVILDDHVLFTDGICNILKNSFTDIKVSKYNSISNLQNNITDYSDIDLLISDIELPNENIFDFLTGIKSNKTFKGKILVISMHNKLSVIKQCKQIGIDGYILKDDQDPLKDVITEIINGKQYYSKKVLETLNILQKKEFILTPKEELIMKNISEGKDVKNIAGSLFISTNTIKTHKKNIYRKLNLNSTAELVKYYLKNYI